MTTQQSADDQLKLGEIIRRQRELAELSMRQVAAMAGISNPYLSQIEHGLRAPSEEVLRAIAESLNVSADLLRGDQQEDGSAEVIEAYQALRRVTLKHRKGRGAR